nr:PEGA domain-containing protein [Myxococcota bacterium]
EHSEGGQIKGKFAYMSPEQSLGLPLDDRSDVFCIGILMHEALIGRPLFDREDRLATVRALARGDVPDVRELRGDVPETVSRLVRRALSSNVESRPRMKELHELVLAARASVEDPNGVVQEVVRGLDPSWRDWRASLKTFDRDPRSSTFPLATPVSQITRKSVEQPLDPPRDTRPEGAGRSEHDPEEDDTEEDVTALAFRPKELRSPAEAAMTAGRPAAVAEPRETLRPPRSVTPRSVTPEPVDFGLEEEVAKAAPRRGVRIAVALVAALAGLGAAAWLATGDESSDAPSTNAPSTNAPSALSAPSAAEPNGAGDANAANASPNGNGANATPNAQAPNAQAPNAQAPNAQAPNDATPNDATPNDATPNAQAPNAPTPSPDAPVEEARPTLPIGTSTLLVQSRPPGARVRFDDVLLPDTTPARFTQLPAGRHQVTIELEGHQPKQQWVRLRPNAGGVIRARLRRTR